MEIEAISNIDITDVFDKQLRKSDEFRVEKIAARKKRLRKLKHWILDNQSKIQEAIYNDFKKPFAETDLTEVGPILLEINHAISHLNNWSQDEYVDGHITYLGTSGFIRYEPKGVCLIISPWNYPFQLLMGPVVSAIAAGNTVICKPSEISANTSALIKKMMEEVYPQDEVAVFEGGVDVTTELLKLPFNHIFFTGSPPVGKIVMEAAAKNLASVTLELGGKSPVIIDKSANIHEAARRVAWGKLLNTGQTCVSPDYILIHESKKEQFIEALKSEMIRQFKEGRDSFDQSPSYGRIINERHYKRLNDIIKDAIEKGANLVFGGKTNDEDNFISPTFFDGIPQGSKLEQEEIFGPVCGLRTFQELSEVVSIVNAHPKPLSMYIFDRNKKNRNYLLQRIPAGSVAINETVLQFAHPNLPFGGDNNSGIGKSHGKSGFLAFSNQKSVMKQKHGFSSISLLRPPYSKAGKFINLLIKFILK